MLNREKIKLILKSKLLLFISKDKDIQEIDSYSRTVLNELVPNADEILLTMCSLYARELQQLYHMEREFTVALKHHKVVKDKGKDKSEAVMFTP